MDIATGLHAALTRAAIPVVSVSIGNSLDRSTWFINYGVSATAEQRASGEALKATYDAATDTAYVDEMASAELDAQKMLKAFAIWTAGKLSVPTATMRSQVLAIYKTL